MSCIVKVRSWEQVQWRAETAAERTFHRQTAFCGWVLKPPLLLGRGVFSFHSQLQEPERKCVPLCMTGGVSSFTPHSCWFIPQTGLPLAVLSIPHQPEETSLSSFHSCTSFLLEASCSPFSIPTLSSLGRAETVPWQTDTNASSLVCLLSSTAHHSCLGPHKPLRSAQTQRRQLYCDLGFMYPTRTGYLPQGVHLVQATQCF